ncbi:hypothetical protein M5K25_008268 [Dendrobium thyrsiflorum]|uniref:Uncharacterized protein n=1 Tax=Dendrobium thyrsiflorum TaxID=117978 RepID=A0ABD0V8R3_DENTH
MRLEMLKMLLQSKFLFMINPIMLYSILKLAIHLFFEIYSDLPQLPSILLPFTLFVTLSTRDYMVANRTCFYDIEISNRKWRSSLILLHIYEFDIILARVISFRELGYSIGSYRMMFDHPGRCVHKRSIQSTGLYSYQIVWTISVRLTETLEERVRVRERFRFGEKERSCEGLSEEITEVSQEKMASSSKRSRISKGSSSSSSRNENFLSKENETAYGSIDFQILPLFSSMQLSFILTLTHSYNKEMFLQFISNMRVIHDSTRMTSFVMQQKVTINKEDLRTFLHLRTEGDRLHTLLQDSDISWSSVNETLRENKDKYHQPHVYTLHQNARIIQHVLRCCIIPKAGDRVNMTPLLYMTKRKKNIALGHLVCYIFEKKYNLIYPEPPTEEPIFFTNASFRSLFHDPPAEGEDLEGEREAPPEHAPAPNQNAYQDMIRRFDTMEVNFGQRFDQIELHMKAQEDQHNLDMT